MKKIILDPKQDPDPKVVEKVGSGSRSTEKIILDPKQGPDPKLIEK
jgi:hypothetical protein